VDDRTYVLQSPCSEAYVRIHRIDHTNHFMRFFGGNFRRFFCLWVACCGQANFNLYVALRQTRLSTYASQRLLSSQNVKLKPTRNKIHSPSKGVAVSLADQLFSEEYGVQVVDREPEKQLLKEYLQGVLAGKKRALYIYGPPGVGKTTTTKHVVNQFEDAYAAEIIYKNSASTTPNQVLHEIHNRICPDVEGKVPSKTLVQRILNHKLKESKFTLVLVLDNFDRMQHVDDLLWDVHCISQKLPRMALILISTRQAKLRHLIGERLHDRLNPEPLEFSPYSAKRLFEIISARIKDAYPTDFVEDNALWDLSDFVAERGGNARYLFSLFQDAVDLLPSKSSARLSSTEIEEMIQRETTEELSRTLEDMRRKMPEQYDLFRLIESSRATLDTGTVISLAQQGGLHVSPRTIQNYLVELDRLGLVELQRIRKGQGHSQRIKPRVSLKDLR